MDMAMSWTLCRLDATASASLWLRRLAPSRYEIDGRRVTVTWRNQKRTDLVACEEDVPNADAMPLLDYLRQAAGVASSLGSTKAPGAKKGMDAEDLAPRGFSDVDSERIRSMMLACRQAGVQE